MKRKYMRHTVLATSVLFAAGCATAPGAPAGNDLGSQLKKAFASDDPCSNNSRNIGILGGAVLGAILGNAVGNGKDESKLIGAALGGTLGGFIGADMDRKRCELSKVAKKYDLEITYANVEAQGEVATAPSAPAAATTSASATPAVIGNTVTVRDKDGAASHFESGSDRLTPKAQEYFAAIAAQYSPEASLAGQTDPKNKDAIAKQLGQRHILLMGHTDDTGSSALNASLSERRARAVAAYLKQKGVPEGNVYYQGAGEALPIADNRTEAGRAANRRVEIVELIDEASFKKYLGARKPNYAYYRARDTSVAVTPANPSPAASAVATKPETVSRNSAATNTPAANAPSTKAVRTAQAPLPTPSANVKAPQAVGPVINFGGVPYSRGNAKLDSGSLVPERGGFSLISKAYADDSVLLGDCTQDRPRAVGAVKSLRDGSSYKTSEHLPQLYGKTWAAMVNDNLVVINRLAVLRDGGAPANLPELKVYAQYKPSTGQKPQVSEEPEVNSYLVDKGVLYRMFPRGDGGLKCMDVLFGTDGATSAKAGKLVYAAGANNFVADFKPQIQ